MTKLKVNFRRRAKKTLKTWSNRNFYAVPVEYMGGCLLSLTPSLDYAYWLVNWFIKK